MYSVAPRSPARRNVMHRLGGGYPPGDATVQPTTTVAPMLWLRLLVTRSMRSAAALRAAATAAWVAWPRSAAATRASCRPASSVSSRRMRWRASLSSSLIVSAAMTRRRLSPISPKLPRSCSTWRSSSLARRSRWLSCPSSQAIRYWRPLMETVTCAMTPFLVGESGRGSTRKLSLSLAMCLNDRADGIDGGVESMGDFPVRALERTHPRGLSIEIGGQPRAIRAECPELCPERLLATVCVAPPLQRRLQRIERQGETLAGSVNRACVGHLPPVNSAEICTVRSFFYVKTASRSDS